MILGIDEVGRGPWAGPLVVGAVVLGGETIEGLTDSKKLSKKRRIELDTIIRRQAKAIGLGWVSAKEIDEIGLSASLALATKRAVEQIHTRYEQIIIDGTVNFLKDTGKGKYVTVMKKADLLIPAVSAASIVAKVARDAFMEEQDALYPEYGFSRHVGYGTMQHTMALKKHGPTPLHRMSFSPLASIRIDSIKQKSVREGTTKQIGDDAETIAASHLKHLGHTILHRNWKTKQCEIDIVSQKGDTIYFCEVKYRASQQQGGGMAAITAKKLRQMKFAASLYTASSKDTHNLQLVAIAMSGKPALVDELIEIV